MTKLIEESSFITVRVSKKIHKRVRNWCFDNGIKLQEFVQTALETELELRGANHGKRS